MVPHGGDDDNPLRGLDFLLRVADISVADVRTSLRARLEEVGAAYAATPAVASRQASLESAFVSYLKVRHIPPGIFRWDQA